VERLTVQSVSVANLTVIAAMGKDGSDMDKDRELEQLQAARSWCASQFKKRYNTKMGHASFLAATILKEASEKFKLADCGVEGWTYGIGRTGVQYLNYGDSYTPTIYVRSNETGASFCFGRNGWAPLVGG
jgi:hypothetical protein